MIDLVFFNTIVNALFNIGMIFYMIYKVLSIIKNAHKIWLFLKKCVNGISWLYKKITMFFFNKRTVNIEESNPNLDNSQNRSNDSWYKRFLDKIPFFRKRSKSKDTSEDITLSLISSEINHSTPLLSDDAMERRYFQLVRNTSSRNHQDADVNTSLYGSNINGIYYSGSNNYSNNYSGSSFVNNAVESQFINDRSSIRRFSTAYVNYANTYKQNYSNEYRSLNYHPLQINIEEENNVKHTQEYARKVIDSQYIKTNLIQSTENSGTRNEVSLNINENNDNSDDDEPPLEFTEYKNYWKDLKNVNE